MKLQQFSDDEKERINRNLVPIVRAFTVMVQWGDKPSPEPIVLVQIDVNDRSDVADLLRVARQEGIQRRGYDPPIYGMQSGDEWIIERFDVSDPVDCFFALRFTWAAHKAALRDMAALGMFMLTTRDADDPEVINTSLGIKINGPELQRVITTWEANA